MLADHLLEFARLLRIATLCKQWRETDKQARCQSQAPNDRDPNNNGPNDNDPIDAGLHDAPSVRIENP
jgi:hypothetical protein